MSYQDTQQKIQKTLTGRNSGTQITPDSHQNMAETMLNYIQEVENISVSGIEGIVYPDTEPVQPDAANVVYISAVPSNTTYTYKNFADKNGDAVSITATTDPLFVILFWNKKYWSYLATTSAPHLHVSAELTDSNDEVPSSKAVNDALQDIYKRSNPNDEDGNIVDTNTIFGITDNPQYVGVFTDLDGRFLGGFEKEDGNFVFVNKVPRDIQDAINAAVKQLQTADQTLKENIDAEGKARQTADQTLKENIDAEGKARQTADQTLKENIDAEIQDVYKKSNYNDGDNIIDFNTIHLIEDNPEYLVLCVDKFNRIFLGIKTDGQPYFGVGCPQQIKEYVNAQIDKILGTNDITSTIDSLKEIENFLKDFTNSNTLKQLLDSKAEKTELSKETERATNSEKLIKTNLDDAYKKSNPNDNVGNVIDTNSIVSIGDDPEYIGVLKDSVSKLIEAIGLDGVRKFFAGIDIQGVKMSVKDNSPYAFLLLDEKGRIGLGVTKEGKLISCTLDELEKSLKDYVDNKDFKYDDTAIKAEIKKATDSATNAATNAANKSDAVQSSLNSVNASIVKNTSDITKNASDIANLKKLSGYDVANDIDTRLTTAENDISNLKSQSGIGTDIISQNGGEDFIKQYLYGYKRILFASTTHPGGIGSGHADNSLTLFHFSDIHDDNASASRIKSFVDKFKTIDGKTTIDDVVFTGDMVVLTYGASLNKNEWKDWGFENYLWGTGNHDIIPGDTSAQTFMNGEGWGRVPHISVYNKYIAPYVANWGVVQPTDAATKGKNYYYKDYPELGYRLFMCDCFNYRIPYKEVDGTLTEIENTFDYKRNHYIASTDDMSTITDAKVGLIIYVGGTNSEWDGYVVDEVNNGVPTKWSKITFKDDVEYQSEQLDWLATELNNAKTLGYHCIIGMHCTPKITSSVNDVGAFNTVGSELLSGGYWVEQCKKIGDTCDTFVANGGIIACMLCGHTHRDELNYHNNILCITISTASTTRDDSNDIRVYGERSQDALNLLAFNKGKGILTIQRIGVNKDSFGQGKNFIVYDYINKKVKYQY